MTKIDPEFKVKWLAALRSGEYIQGQGALRTDLDGHNSSYCCLGVACSLLPNLVTPTQAGRTFNFKDREGVGGGTLPPDIVARIVLGGESDPTIWVNDLPPAIQARIVKECSPYAEGIPDGENYEDTLSMLNDGGCSFELIADIINAVL